MLALFSWLDIRAGPCGVSALRRTELAGRESSLCPDEKEGSEIGIVNPECDDADRSCFCIHRKAGFVTLLLNTNAGSIFLYSPVGCQIYGYD